MFLVNFWFLCHMTLMVTWPRKCKFAVISETVRDGPKRSKFSTLLGYCMQYIKIWNFLSAFSDCWHDKFSTISPVRSRNFNFFKYILFRYLLETLLLVLSKFTLQLKYESDLQHSKNSHLVINMRHFDAMRSSSLNMLR